MEISVSWYDCGDIKYPLVHLPEKITMANAMQVEDHLKLLKNMEYIVLDFAGVQLMDSSGLAMLVRHRDKIMLCSPQPTIKSLFDLTRLTEVLKIYESFSNAQKVIEYEYTAMEERATST